jgi:hypothetical protein
VKIVNVKIVIVNKMKLTEYVLTQDWTFQSNSRRRKSFVTGTKFLVEKQVMPTIGSEMECTYYFVYAKPDIVLSHYDELEFKELFVSLDEWRNSKINMIIN